MPSPTLFEETDVQKELRDLTRRFAQKEILPHVEADDEKENFRPDAIQK
jgi:alkylation response protein AidB-like acyl-CoA dehydrogenase